MSRIITTSLNKQIRFIFSCFHYKILTASFTFDYSGVTAPKFAGFKT